MEDNSTHWHDQMDSSIGNRGNGTDHFTLSFWMNGVLSLALVIIGMLGNSSIMVSFHFSGDIEMKRRRRQAFYYYLMTFALWNTGLLLATVLFNCLPTLLTHNSAHGDEHILHLSSIFYMIGYWIGNICVTADVWLAVAVTIERYLAIARPLRSRLTSPRRRARLVCILLSVFAICYNLPLAFELTFTTPDHSNDDYSSVGSDSHNETIEKVSWTEETQRNKLCLSPMRDNVYYQFVYRVIGNVMFVSLVPFLIVLLLTIKIVLVVRESERSRAKLRSSVTNTLTPNESNTSVFSTPSSKNSLSTSHRYVHVLLTLIAAKFLIFYTLPVIINIVELTTDPRIFESDESEPARVLLFFVDLANLLVVIDGATNSFFYFSWRNRVKFGGQRQANAMGMESRGVQAEPVITDSKNRLVLEIVRCDWAGRQQSHLRLPQKLNRGKQWIPLKNFES